MKQGRTFFRQQQSGASMLEALVALVVLSLGLLGMAAMQVATSKYQVNVQAHAAVMRLVSDLSERIRINPDEAGTRYGPGSEDVQTNGYTLRSAWAAQQAQTLSADKNCLKNVCTAAERAQFDMADWRQKVRDALPQGAAWVEGSLQRGFAIALMWMDKEQKETRHDAVTGLSTTEATQARTCAEDEAGRLVQNCCPESAAVPAGVRCWRFSVLP